MISRCYFALNIFLNQTKRNKFLSTAKIRARQKYINPNRKEKSPIALIKQ